MKRVIVIFALLLVGSWALKGQDIGVNGADSPDEVMAKPQEAPEAEEFNPDIYWMQGDLKRAGYTIKYNGSRLPKDDRNLVLYAVGGDEMVGDWHKYATMRGWGTGTLAGGSVLFLTGVGVGGIYILAGVVGTIFVAIAGKEAVDKLWADMNAKAAVGGYIMLAGVGSMTTGIVLLSVSNSKMRHMVRTCNEAGMPREANFAFGPTCSGVIVLTYNF